MNELDLIALQYSFTRLAQLTGVAVLSEWRPIAEKDVWMLRLRLDLQGAKPTSYIAQETEWELVIDFTVDPWGKVQVHPVLDNKGLTATFVHQQFNGGPHPRWPCRNGHICTVSWLQGLTDSRNAHAVEPASTVDRIFWHVARTQEWLTIAANDTLTIPGDPFELPDFNISGVMEGSALAYYEDARTYEHWQEQKEQSGIVELVSLGATLFPHRYYDCRGRTLLYEPTWGDYIRRQPTVRKAVWVRLDSLPVINKWQVPTTWSELVAAVGQQGIDLLERVDRPLAHLQEPGECLLMLGMPIPRRVGEIPSRYHWQALQLLPPSVNASPKARTELAKNRIRSNSALRWHKIASNWHPEDLQNRGRLSESLIAARVVILGAGALGSALAEQLIRMGLQQVTIIDGDHLEPGNLVRHTLAVSDLYQFKATALANRLNQINPSAQAVGLATNLPSSNPALETAMAEASLIIDATASDMVLKEIPFKRVNPMTPIVSCSLGINAERLFFYATLNGQFDWQTFDKWFSPFREEENQLANQIELPRGVGCWHTLVPARLNRVAGLAGIAIELIEQVYESPVPLPIMACYTWPIPSLPVPGQ